MSKTIGIVGSRRRNSPTDFELVKSVLLKVYKVGDGIVSGGCPEGADSFAATLAYELQIALYEWLPDESKIDQKLMAMGLKRAAWAQICYARNTLIARDSDVLIACVAEDRKGGGTEDTIKKFCKQRSIKSSKPLKMTFYF